MSNGASVQELLEKGLYYYGLGEIEQALKYWREVIKLDPANETAREYIEIETGQSSDAAAEDEAPPPPAPEEAKAPPEAPKSRALAESFMLGQQFLATNNFEKAVTAFESAHAEDSDNPIYWAHVELARARLIKEVVNMVGGMRNAISLRVPLTQLIGEKKFTQEEGFVLSMITGDTGIEDVVSLSPIPRFKSYQIIYRLLREGLAESGGEAF